MTEPQEHHLTVTRTARFQTLGTLTETTKEVWFVLHGYGQLAASFLKPFHVLDESTRYIIAPEALSRFYNRLGGPVGAAWMTREDRQNDITDYVAYLDAVYAHTFANLNREHVRVHLLGFSQGATTACRWALLGNASLDRLIMWGGNLPHDLNLTTYQAALNALNLTIVVGDEDHYITPERLAEEQKRLSAAGITYHLHPYAGKHRVLAEVLAQVA